MLFLLGEKRVLHMLHVLAWQEFQQEELSVASLRRGYQHLLDKMQPRVPHALEGEPAYVTDSNVVTQLINIFSLESRADDTNYDMSEVSAQGRSHMILQRTCESANRLGELYPPFDWVFRLVTDTVFNAHSEAVAGGTTSAAVGVLFVDLRDHWSEQDVYEFLIHELGHNLLFLAEWQHGLFTSTARLVEPTTHAMSAIRAQMRPLDKAFHSAVVATDVLLLREQVLGHDRRVFVHPSSKELLPMTLRSIESIQETGRREGMLTAYAQGLMEMCTERLEKLAAKVV